VTLPVAGAEPGPNRIVELPPLLVSEPRNPLPWRYAEATGLEVLSLCPDYTTKEFMMQFCHLRQLLQLVIPPELQLSLSVPVVHILCGTEMQGRLNRDVLVDMFHTNPAAPAEHVHVLPNLRLMANDAYTVFALVDPVKMERSQLSLTPDYVSFTLQRRVPPLPAWFAVGVLHLYDSMLLDSKEIQLAPVVWLSDEGTEAVRKDPAAAALTLLPMEELLIAPRPPLAPAESVEHYREIWIAQSALFVRWALDGRSLEERQAYFKFVDRASRGPVTEALFREGFGLGFDEMRARLGAYLPVAIGGTLRLHPDAPLETIKFSLGPATPAEIGRIKGDWERLETAYVKKSYPALSGNYLDQARRTLRRAYDLGERDPRLLAVMGLCECDAGDDAAALPFLTAAVEARVVRPLAYAELARILYAQARAKPAGTQGKLSSPQTAAIVNLLLTARGQSPPLSDLAELFSDIWFHSDVRPLPSDLVHLDEDTILFPRSANLSYRVALLDAQAGQWPSVRRLVDRGLATAPNATIRDRFAQLQGLLPPMPP